MLFLFLLFAVDALILISLLNIILGDDIEFWSGFGLAVGAGIGLSIIDYVLTRNGLNSFLALAIASFVICIVLGAVLSLFYGTPLKSSCFVAGGFILCHIIVVFCFTFASALFFSSLQVN